jgi:hypothetical protein
MRMYRKSMQARCGESIEEERRKMRKKEEK